MKSGDPLPKMDLLRGSLHQELKWCGKPNCRCARGHPHGPYWVRRWREGGRQRKQYIRPGDVDDVRAAIVQYRDVHPPAWQMRQDLAALRRLMQEMIDG